MNINPPSSDDDTEAICDRDALSWIILDAFVSYVPNGETSQSSHVAEAILSSPWLSARDRLRASHGE